MEEKKPKKKVIRYILIGILVLILVISLLFSLFGDKAIRVAVETGATKALQVDVRLENISTHLLGGKVDLVNLEVDNPEGYQHESFMKIGHLLADLKTSSLLSDTIEIDMIQLEDISLTIEQKGLTSNIKQILNNLPKSESEEPEPEPTAEEEKPGKNLHIHVLEINNVEVKAKLLPTPGRADTVTIRLKPIRLTDLGTDKKLDVAGLTAKILSAIAKGVAEQASEILPTEMIGDIGKELGKQGEQILKTGQEVGGQLLEGTKDIGKGATDAVKGIGDLFKKKEESE